MKAKAERDLVRLREQLQLAHEALGEPTPEEVQRGGYGKMSECIIWITNFVSQWTNPYAALQSDIYIFFLIIIIMQNVIFCSV